MNDKKTVFSLRQGRAQSFFYAISLLLISVCALSLAFYCFPPFLSVDFSAKDTFSVDLQKLSLRLPLTMWAVVLLCIFLLWYFPLYFITSDRSAEEKDGQITGVFKTSINAKGRQIPLFFADSLTFLPFWLIGLWIYIEPSVYRDISVFFVSWSIVAHLFLRISLYRWVLGQKTNHFLRVKRFIRQLTRGQSVVCIFFLFFMCYFFIALVFVYNDMYLEGDEPEYVIVAQSILKDGDLYIKNNYDLKEYTYFYRHPLAFGRTTWEGYPVEGLLPSLYILPVYAAARYLEISPFPLLRIAVTPIAALFIALLFLFLLNLDFTKKTALLITSCVGFSGPVLFFAPLLFSEVWGALLVTISLLAILSRIKEKKAAFFGAISIPLLLWVGAKYCALAIPLALWYLGLHINSVRKRFNTKQRFIVVVSIGLLLVLTLSYFVFIKHYYNSYSPLATRGGELLDFTTGEKSSFSDSLQWLLGDRLEKLPYSIQVGVGYFFDQRVGILFYSPFYLLLFTGLLLLRKKDGIIYLGIMMLGGIYWFMLFWLSYWEGYGPPTRYLVPVTPLFASLIALAYERRAGSRLVLRMSMLWSGVIILMALVKPYLLYHHTLWRFSEEKNNFLEYLSGDILRFSDYFPSFTSIPFDWPAFMPWLILFFITLFFSYRKTSGLFFKSCTLFLFFAGPFLLVLSLFSDTFPASFVERNFSRPTCSVNMQLHSFDGYEMENNAIWIKTKRSVNIAVTAKSDQNQNSDAELNDFNFPLQLHSLVKNRVLVDINGIRIHVNLPPGERKNLIFHAPQKNSATHSPTLKLKLKPLSGKNLFIAENHTDGRELGLFVQFPQ